MGVNGSPQRQPWARPAELGPISQYAPSSRPAAHAARPADVRDRRQTSDRRQTASSLNAMPPGRGGHKNYVMNRQIFNNFWCATCSDTSHRKIGCAHLIIWILLNGTSAFFKGSHRYFEFVKSLTKIQPLLNSDMEDRFRKMQSPDHCLYPPPTRQTSQQ